MQGNIVYIFAQFLQVVLVLGSRIETANRAHYQYSTTKMPPQGSAVVAFFNTTYVYVGNSLRFNTPNTYVTLYKCIACFLSQKAAHSRLTKRRLLALPILRNFSLFTVLLKSARGKKMAREGDLSAQYRSHSKL